MTEEQRERLESSARFYKQACTGNGELNIRADSWRADADAIDAALAEIDRQAKRIERLEKPCRDLIERWNRYYDNDALVNPHDVGIDVPIEAIDAALEGRD